MIKIAGLFIKKNGHKKLQRNVFVRLSRSIHDPFMDLQTWRLNDAFLAISMPKYIHTNNHFSCDEGGLILVGHTAEHDPMNAKALFSLYKKNGPEFMDRIRGIFSVVFWDNRLKMVGIINDKLGLCPLYYYEDDTKFVFSTDAEVLFKERSLRKEIDLRAVAEFFHFGFLLDGKTFVLQVKNLSPGTLLQFRRGFVSQKPYRYVSIFKRHFPGVQNTELRIRKVFQDAVSRRIGGGCKTVIHLSGGRDSRLIVACLTAMKQPIHALTFLDEDTICEDILLARQVSKRIGFQHSVIRRKNQSVFGASGIGVKEQLGQIAAVYPPLKDQALFQALFEFPTLSGLMGGEVIGKDVNVYTLGGAGRPTENIFTSSFIHKLNGSPPIRFEQTILEAQAACPQHATLFLFIHHICRSFLNTIEGPGWAQMARKFTAPKTFYPFLDEDFLAFVFSLPAKALGASAYNMLYQKCFSEFCDIPFLSSFPKKERQALQGLRIRAASEHMARRDRHLAARVFKDPLDTAQKYPREFFYFLKWYKEYGQCL